jgi:hypothetical protein
VPQRFELPLCIAHRTRLHAAPILTSPLVSSTHSDFTCLPPGARARLVDALCSNTSVLTSTCGMLDATADAAQLVSHRGALKAYCFFLTHLLLAAEAESKDAPVAKARGAAPAKKTLAPLNGQLARLAPPSTRVLAQGVTRARPVAPEHVSGHTPQAGGQRTRLARGPLAYVALAPRATH